MQALGLPAPLCDAACEVVADAHGDCVDGSVLPSALAVAGVTPVDALRVYAALVKVRVEGVSNAAPSPLQLAPLGAPRVCVCPCVCMCPARVRRGRRASLRLGGRHDGVQPGWGGGGGHCQQAAQQPSVSSAPCPKCWAPRVPQAGELPSAFLECIYVGGFGWSHPHAQVWLVWCGGRLTRGFCPLSIPLQGVGHWCADDQSDGPATWT